MTAMGVLGTQHPSKDFHTLKAKLKFTKGRAIQGRVTVDLSRVELARSRSSRVLHCLLNSTCSIPNIVEVVSESTIKPRLSAQ